MVFLSDHMADHMADQLVDQADQADQLADLDLWVELVVDVAVIKPSKDTVETGKDTTGIIINDMEGIVVIIKKARKVRKVRKVSNAVNPKVSRITKMVNV